MAGLGATLNCSTIGRISAALSARGPGVAQCSLRGVGGSPLELVVRAVMPAIPRVVGEVGEDETIAAFAIDGIASVSQLDARYAEDGATGLVVEADPYAVILADAERGELVLARGGEGPGLYYARLGDGWVAASEPGALLAAGVSSAPDPATVERFVRTGACDDTVATFFADIRRVGPRQAVVLGAGGAVRVYQVSGGAPATNGLGPAMRAAVVADRVAIRLAPGAAGAALLATALEAAPRSRPLPVHAAIFPGLGGALAHTPAVLVPLPYGAVHASVHPFAPETFDLDGFLRDVGEPVPDPHVYLLWAIARYVTGSTDTLVDSHLDTTTATGCDWFARFSDRVRARYGVTMRRPVRAGPDDHDVSEELRAIAARGLPPAAVRHAWADSAAAPTPADLLLPLRADLAAAFVSEEFAARPWNDRVAVMAELRELSAGRGGDAGGLWRRYLVERWLATLRPPSAENHRRPPPEDVSTGLAVWSRVPVLTERFVPGDPLAAKAAWHVSTRLAELTTEKPYSSALRSPWLVVISGKPVSVSQRRVNPLWEVRPGAAARVLSAIARRGLPRLGDPWTMQVAIAEGGLARVAAGALVGRLGLRRWYASLLPPDAINVFAPRPGAVAPADSAVVRAPWKPDEFASALVEALRLAVPAESFLTLAGCAIVSADDAGARVLGFAPGPHADAVPDPVELVAILSADNPAGQADEQTPVVVAVRAPRRSAADRDVKEPRAAQRPPTRAGRSPSR